MTTQAVKPWLEVPTDFIGSPSEWAIYWACTDRKLRPNEEFTYNPTGAVPFVFPGRASGIVISDGGGAEVALSMALSNELIRLEVATSVQCLTRPSTILRNALG